MAYSPVKPGYFIVVEGIDGSGVSTQAALLARHLDSIGRNAHLTKEPTTGPIGSLVRQALTGRLVYAPLVHHGVDVQADAPAYRRIDDQVLTLLYAADRLDHLGQEVEPLLARGVDVVSDRYLLSTLAFQSLGASTDWIMQVNQKARRPDLTVFLDVQPEVSMSRMAHRGGQVELYEDSDKSARARDNYLRFIPMVRDEGEAIAVVAGGGTPQDVHALVWSACVETFPDLA
jgi:dTMP kinase